MDEKIFVELRGNPFECIAEVPIPFSDATIYAASEENYVDAIAELRQGLAAMGRTGKMEIRSCTDELHSEEQIDAAFDLPEEELTITPEYIQRVRSEGAEKEKRGSGGLERLIEFMEAQAQDEEENITVGEALRRAREGKEQVHRIVEGEEPGADPKGGRGDEPATDPA